MDELAKVRNAKLKKRFGIGIEQYNEMLEKQNNRCKICGWQKQAHNRNLAVDHCHKTGKIRGLLCYRCNYFLGAVQDDIPTLIKMCMYLEGCL